MGASRATMERTMSIRHVVDTHGPDAARHVLDEAHAQHSDLGLADAARRLLLALRALPASPKTHVIIGDHQPEPRALGKIDT